MPKRILIADDNEDIRRVIRWFLESRTACEVCGEAVNGVDAIEKADTLHPDLILFLRGQVKSGQRGSCQNRPTDLARDLVLLA
jgi:DNA-binding NarL/FixJ family response regulator